MNDDYQENNNQGLNSQGFYKQDNRNQEAENCSEDTSDSAQSYNSTPNYSSTQSYDSTPGYSSTQNYESTVSDTAADEQGSSYHYRGSELEQSSYRSSELYGSDVQSGNNYGSNFYGSNMQNESSCQSSSNENGAQSTGSSYGNGTYNSYEFSQNTDSTACGHLNEPVRSERKVKKEKSRKKSATGKKFGLCAALAATFGLIAGGVFLGVAAVGTNALGLDRQEAGTVEIPKAETSQSQNSAGNAQAVSSTVGDLTVAQVAENCMPAMVAITNKSIQEIPNFFGYGSQAYESESSGSGIIIDQNDTELLIATNNHVVSGADSLTVAFTDGELVEGMIKGSDNHADLAVVAVKISDIKAETLQQIKVIQIGDSNDLKVGDQVVAIGNALGFGQSVSSGYVSALDREVTIENETHMLIQTDAAINPGNSGGALLNMRGELIGINEAKYSSEGVEGMGYAIPVSTATPILSELMSQETRYKVNEDQASYMGVVCRELSSEFTQFYGVAGAYVDSVQEGSPAEEAGIKKGDIITKLDTRSVSSYTDLVDALQYYAAGETISVTISRADDGEFVDRELTITLGSRPKETQR